MIDRSRVPARWRVALAVALGCPIAASAQWKALEGLQQGGARVTAMVTDLSDNRVVQQLNPDLHLSPASVTKLVVAAAALETWPADKTFETRLLASGPVREGVLQGDLMLHGDGDATLDHKDLLLLAAQTRAAGIARVAGKLVVHPAFGPLGCDNKDRCDALDRSGTAYDVPLSALGADYGTWCVDVQPTSAGQPAALRGCGVTRLPIAVEGAVDTVGPRAEGSFWVERVTVDGGDSLKVGGRIPMGDTQRVYRAMSDPALGAGLMLRQMLVDAGVAVDGGVAVTHDPPPRTASVVATTEGLALREQLGRMLRYSNNYIADLLTLDLSAAQAPRPPTQLADAAKSLSDFLVRTGGKGAGGAAPPAARLFSGSGLTPENELSAGELVAMLGAQYRRTSTFPVFYGGLVVPRQAPFAFLRGGSAAWQDRVALKTGTMNDPRSVCGVAGYLRKRDGGWMAFAILVNGSEKMHHVPLYKAMDAIRSDVEDLLAGN